MSLLLDPNMTKSIGKIATNILSRHFNYDKDSLDNFCQIFAASINLEHAILQERADKEFKHIIWGDKLKQLEFTAHFVGYHLCMVLHEKLHFTETELDCFENILVKYIKVCEPNDIKQDGEGTINRSSLTAFFDL
jgi:hypothetical protein